MNKQYNSTQRIREEFFIKQIILYSTDCPKCKILKQKLDEKNINYQLCSDVDVMKSKGFMSVPMLEVDDNVFNFLEANNWMKENF